MTQADPPPATERILIEVVRLLESGGPEAVVLSEVARRARVSLRDVYKHFGSRDELVVAAVAQWMEAHVYRPLAAPVADAPLFDTLLGQIPLHLRTVGAKPAHARVVRVRTDDTDR